MARFSYFILAIVSIGSVAGLVYWPGLASQFYLDDFPNLSGLSALNGTAGITGEFWHFVFNGVSSSLGRPLSLLTFAFQSADWPDNPHPFKLVNLILHLFNGSLVAILAYVLAGYLNLSYRQKLFFAAVVSLLWLVAPMQVTTVTYVVQRMVLLSATFTLLGVLLYLWGRAQLAAGRWAGYLLLMVFVPLCMILAILAKENGILLCLYILVIEYCFFSGRERPHKFWWLWKVLCLWLPVALLLGYLFSDIDGRILASYRIREFTLPERLLTESRILWDYVRLILFPSGSDFTLFHDDVVISRGLMQPVSTLMASVAWLLALTLAIRLRYGLPVLSFSILWFLAGHVLESSFLGLELSFEHRNYLPMFGIWFGVAFGAWRLAGLISSRRIRQLYWGGCAVYIFSILFITHQQTVLLKDPVKHAFYLLEQNPDSVRTRALVVSIYEGSDHIKAAAVVSKSMVHDWPGLTGGYFQMLYLQCLDEEVLAPDVSEIKSTIQTTNFDLATIGYLRKIVSLINSGECNSLSGEQVEQLIFALRENPKFSSQDARLFPILARVYAGQGDYDKAANAYRRLREDQHFMLEAARYAATDEQFERALALLDKAERVSRGSFRESFRRKEIERLRKVIIEDMRVDVEKFL